MNPKMVESNYIPWCTKNTASQTNRFSVEGTMYIPRGQCSLWRKDAYSRETAVRVTGLVVVLVGWGAVGLVVARDFVLEAPKSIVGDGTRPDNMFEKILVNSNNLVAMHSLSKLARF
jgi:hypothetical protein